MKLKFYTVDTTEDVATAAKEAGYTDPEQISFLQGFVFMMVAARGWCRWRELVFHPKRLLARGRIQMDARLEAMEGLEFVSTDKEAEDTGEDRP